MARLSGCVFMKVNYFGSKQGNHMSHSFGVDIDLIILINFTMENEFLDNLFCLTFFSKVRVCEGHDFVVREDVWIIMS